MFSSLKEALAACVVISDMRLLDGATFTILSMLLMKS